MHSVAPQYGVAKNDEFLQTQEPSQHRPCANRRCEYEVIAETCEIHRSIPHVHRQHVIGVLSSHTWFQILVSHHQLHALLAEARMRTQINPRNLHPRQPQCSGHAKHIDQTEPMFSTKPPALTRRLFARLTQSRKRITLFETHISTLWSRRFGHNLNRALWICGNELSTSFTVGFPALWSEQIRIMG